MLAVVSLIDNTFAALAVGLVAGAALYVGVLVLLRSGELAELRQLRRGDPSSNSPAVP
jgi:hypothetical protein